MHRNSVYFSGYIGKPRTRLRGLDIYGNLYDIRIIHKTTILVKKKEKIWASNTTTPSLIDTQEVFLTERTNEGFIKD